MINIYVSLQQRIRDSTFQQHFRNHKNTNVRKTLMTVTTCYVLLLLPLELRLLLRLLLLLLSLLLILEHGISRSVRLPPSIAYQLYYFIIYVLDLISYHHIITIHYHM